MEAARHLSPVPRFDRETGELEPEGCLGCAEKQDQIDGLTGKVAGAAGRETQLKRELANMQGVEAGSDEIREVLEHAREVTGRTRARIIPGSPGWKAVKARLADRDVDGNQAFTVASLKLAADGAMRSAWHVRNKQLKPETIFGDAGKVEAHVERMLEWEAKLVPILKLPIPMEQRSLDFLAEYCDCGHLRIEHTVNRMDGPMQGWLPCMAHGCECADFDDFFVEQRWKDVPR